MSSRSFSFFKNNYFLFFLILACCLEADRLLGPYAVEYLFDTTQTVGARVLNSSYILKNYGLQAWNPLYQSGFPEFVTGKHPWGFRTFLFSIFPLWLGQSIVQVGAVSLYSAGLFRFLNEYFNVNRMTAYAIAIVSLVLSFGAMTTIIIVYAFPYLFMWLRDIALGRGTTLGALLKTVLLACLMSMTTFVFVIPYYIPMAFILITLLWDGCGSRKRLLFVNSVFWAGYIFFYTPTLWSFIDFLPNVFRYELIPFPGIWPSLLNFAQGIAKVFSMPVAALSLGAFVLFKDSERNKRVLALYVVFVLIVAFTKSPFYDLLQGTLFHKAHLFRVSLLSGLVSAIVAGLVADSFYKSKKPIWFALLGISFFWTWNNEELGIVKTLLVVTLVLFHLWQIGGLKKPALSPATCGSWALVLLCVVVFQLKHIHILNSDAHDFFQKGYGNHLALEKVAERARDEVFRIASVDVHPSIAKSYNIESIDAKDELIYYDYSRMIAEVRAKQYKSRQDSLHALQKDQLFLFITTLPKDKYAIHHVYNKDIPRSVNDLNIPLLEAMNVKILVSAKPIKGIEKVARLVALDKGKGLPDFLKKIVSRDPYEMPLYIYELSETFPRAFFVAGAKVVENNDKVFDILSKSTLKDLRTRVLFSAQDVDFDNFQPSSNSNPTVNIVSYSPDRIVLEGVTPSAGFIVLSNNYDSKWQAAEGEKVYKVYKANGYMQAVYVDRAGAYRIVLEYRSPVFWALQWFTLLGLIMMVGIAFYRPKNCVPYSNSNEVVDGEQPELLWVPICVLLGLFLILGYFFKFKKSDYQDLVIYIYIFAPLVSVLSVGWIKRNWALNRC